MIQDWPLAYFVKDNCITVVGKSGFQITVPLDVYHEHRRYIHALLGAYECGDSVDELATFVRLMGGTVGRPGG